MKNDHNVTCYHYCNVIIRYIQTFFDEEWLTTTPPEWNHCWVQKSLISVHVSHCRWARFWTASFGIEAWPVENYLGHVGVEISHDSSLYKFHFAASLSSLASLKHTLEQKLCFCGGALTMVLKKRFLRICPIFRPAAGTVVSSQVRSALLIHVGPLFNADRVLLAHQRIGFS
jgi:hypothetical protein